MRDVHEAFINHQTAGTRLVTTQADFLVQSWLDATAGAERLLVATAESAALAEHAPEVIQRRAAFAHVSVRRASEILSANTDEPSGLPPTPDVPADVAVLVAAVRAPSAEERLELCVKALDGARVPPALLMAASTCMEVNDLEAAARDLDEALRLAPAWPAAHFERGKLWLRLDDMEQAAVSFRRAADLIPAFGGAWGNLGAALGELDRPEEALAAFERALACDPLSHQAVNNMGVVTRELGRLGESETLFRRVIALAPDLAYGYYNLGHTLFLQGRYQAALSAYTEGQKRDAGRNAVQASRLAVCRLATGDAAGAVTELQRATSGLPRDDRQQLLADTNAIVWALLTDRPDWPGWKQVSDWLSSELGK